MESDNISSHQFLRCLMLGKILTLPQYQCAHQENCWLIGKMFYSVEKVKQGFEIYLSKSGTFIWDINNHEGTERAVVICSCLQLLQTGFLEMEAEG